MAHESTQEQQYPEDANPVSGAYYKYVQNHPALPLPSGYTGVHNTSGLLDSSWPPVEKWPGGPRMLTIVLPSSESHFFDFHQSHAVTGGLNASFPSPWTQDDTKPPFTLEWWDVSGVLKTSGSGEFVVHNEDFWLTYPLLAPTRQKYLDEEKYHHSGVFYPVEVGKDSDGNVILAGQFTNYGAVQPANDFEIFNPFINHHPLLDPNPVALMIPYVSDYVISPQYNPYYIAPFTLPAPESDI